MKKNLFLILSILSLIQFHAFSQYTSPGTGISFTLDDLVTMSAGTVSLTDNDYHVNNTLTISATDTLKIYTDGLMYIHEGIRVNIEGVFLSNPPNTFEIKRANMENNFEGFRFDNSSASVLKNIIFTGGGGIKLVNSDLEITNCEISNFGQEYTTGAIDLFQSNPLIKDCSINNNAGPAIMSGANAESSPQIIHNVINFNVSGNGNTPQINLGTSDPLLSILIDSNYIFGQYEMAGGIAISTLAGGNANAIITHNHVNYNRYGIAQIGSNISTTISYNEIVANNIQNDPMQGGSGLNFAGITNNTSIVSYNTIVQNLWGVTIQFNAIPNLGDGTNESLGHNMIYNNENNSQIYALYNNTPEDIMALDNFWGTADLIEAEEYIYHQVDDPSLGLVSFAPIWSNPVGIEVNKASESMQISPNPCTYYVEISNRLSPHMHYEIYNTNDRIFNKGELTNGYRTINTSEWPKGCYFIKTYSNESISTQKLIVQ